MLQNKQSYNRVVYTNICEVEDREVILEDEQNQLINKIIHKFVNELSKKRQSHDYYKEKRNASIDKVSEDNFLGKKAEVFVAKYLIKERNFPKEKNIVDFEIRNGHNKGWHVDLPFGEKNNKFPNVHVKACTKWILNYVGDYSWTFQWANNKGLGGKDDIFNGPDSDLVVFVYISEARMPSAMIKAIMPWGEVKKHLIDPKNKKLKGLKKCINLQDIKKATGKIKNNIIVGLSPELIMPREKVQEKSLIPLSGAELTCLEIWKEENNKKK